MNLTFTAQVTKGGFGSRGSRKGGFDLQKNQITVFILSAGSLVRGCLLF